MGRAAVQSQAGKWKQAWCALRTVKGQGWFLPKGLRGNEAGQLIIRPHRYHDRTHQGSEINGQINF